MITTLNLRKTQKELYFDTKEIFKKDYEIYRGWYVIFKDNICLYVGQSKNLPSRIATHLKGKYENADEVLFFYNLDEECSELDLTEKLLMQIFKPIENVLVDFNEDININKISESNILYAIESGSDINKESYSSKLVIDNRDGIFISEYFKTILTKDKIFNFIKYELGKANEHKINE